MTRRTPSTGSVAVNCVFIVTGYAQPRNPCRGARLAELFDRHLWRLFTLTPRLRRGWAVRSHVRDHLKPRRLKVPGSWERKGTPAFAGPPAATSTKTILAFVQPGTAADSHRRSTCPAGGLQHRPRQLLAAQT